MLRVVRSIRAGALFLVGAVLVFLYLSINYTDDKTLRFYKNVEKGSAPEKNTTYVYSWPRCQRNLDAANSPGFSSLSSQIQDFLYYRHCRHFPMLLDVPDKCGGADQSANVFLLLVIKSSPKDYEQREVLRKTWAKERLHNGMWIRRIFISGTMETDLDKGRLNKLLLLEQQDHNDILQWDFNDSLFNLTLKQILFLEWMERNCPHAHFLLNGDDDVFANTDNVVEYLQGLEHNNGSQHLFTGHLITNAGPYRSPNSKYYIPTQVHNSDSYPPYCGGGGLILSVHTALVIYNMSQSITIIPIDDVYLGMCLAKAGLDPGSHMGVKTLGWFIPSSKLEQFDPCFFKEHLVVHRFLPADIYVTWERIHEPDLKCGDSMKWLQQNLTTNFTW